MADYGDKPPNAVYGIIEHTGRNFAGGLLLLSGPYQFYKGSTAMPGGARFTGGLQRACMVAPQSAGSLAAWTSIYAATWAALEHLRHKDDPWNSIIGAATASSVTTLRRGLVPTATCFAASGLIMGIFEGVCIVADSYFAQLDHSNNNTSNKDRVVDQPQYN